MPVLKVTRLEGSYLMWVDMRGLGLNDEQLELALMRDAHVFFDDGYYFGEEGSGFERINIACPTECVMKALENLRRWIATLDEKTV
jgi:bifunctional pyridoxal-dependent enzyme with beta-cystathionase and maltose regulon repressor activities